MAVVVVVAVAREYWHRCGSEWQRCGILVYMNVAQQGSTSGKRQQGQEKWQGQQEQQEQQVQEQQEQSEPQAPLLLFLL